MASLEPALRAHSAVGPPADHAPGLSDRAESAGGDDPTGLPGMDALWSACTAALVLVDRTGTICRVNRTVARMFDQPESRFAGKPAGDLLPVDVAHAAVRAGTAPGHQDQQGEVLEQVISDAVGNRRRVSWTLGPVADRHGVVTHLLVTGIDVTAERAQQATLRRSAETDELTGLANRTAVMAALRSCLDPVRGAGCSLLFADLDGFKTINDLHGHAIGDYLLRGVAQRLSRIVRPGDLVGRLGGDEFVVVVPAGGNVDARAMSTRIERVVDRPIPAPDNRGNLKVGISIGLRTADPGEDPGAVLHDADRAMYRRKRQRRDRLAQR